MIRQIEVKDAIVEYIMMKINKMYVKFVLVSWFINSKLTRVV